MVHPSHDHSEAQDSPPLIAGRYRIDAPLAEGGMALVFRGWHVLLEQPIAIKVLKPEYSREPEAVARFLREARATARLRGQHVAHVFDIGKVEGRTPFMVTELLTGSDLGKLLKTGAFSLERAVATLVAVCDAVLDVHAAGIVHRDLKPDNLFLVLGGGEPHVKILDFGVAKPVRPGPSLTLPERGVGSPHYMSPEQIMTPQDVDFRSDVWSLGVVLFELLTARMPFAGVTIPDLCTAIVRSDVEPPSHVRAMPAALEQIICKCLEKDRAARFQSVAALREALRGVQRALTAPEQPDVAVGRPRWMLLLTSLVTCVLAFAAVVLLFNNAHAPEPLVNPRTAPQEQQENVRKASAALQTGLPTAPLCTPGVLPETGMVAGSVDACGTVPQPVVTLAETAEWKADAPVTRAEQSQRVRLPSSVKLRTAREQLEPWLWLERDSGIPELADHEVVDPYPDGPYRRR